MNNGTYWDLKTGRVKWIVGGTSPSFTFTVNAQAK